MREVMKTYYVNKDVVETHKEEWDFFKETLQKKDIGKNNFSLVTNVISWDI